MGRTSVSCCYLLEDSLREGGREELRTKELIHYEPYFEGKQQKSGVLHPGFCLLDIFRMCTFSSHAAMCIFAYLGFYTDLSF